MAQIGRVTVEGNSPRREVKMSKRGRNKVQEKINIEETNRPSQKNARSNWGQLG